MGNVIDYIKQYGSYSFLEKPCTEADMLVFAQLSYLKFDGMAAPLKQIGNPISFADRSWVKEDVMFADKRYEKENRQLWAAVTESKRFGDMQIDAYVNLVDEKVETQFSAMLLLPSGVPPVVVFRGTDENIVGWKEDFNMVYKKPVEAQKLGLLYVNDIGEWLDGEFMICGHSKGGNLAVYSAVNAKKSVKEKIKEVYSFDGPGFRPEIRGGEEWEKMEKKIKRYIPQSSLVGMLFERPERAVVVSSRNFGIFQHDLYSWRIEKDGRFSRIPELQKRKMMRGDILNEWIFSLSQEEAETFVESLYKVIMSSGVSTVMEFEADLKNCMKKVMAAMKELDGETRQKIRQIFKELIKIATTALLEERRRKHE